MSLAALLRSRINQPELSPGHQTRRGCLRGLPSSGSPVELAEDCHSHLWKPFAPIESRFPECKCSRPAPWCRCSCSPLAYPRSPGTAVGLSNRHEHGGSSMLVLSRKRLESVVVGGDVGFERLLKVTVLELRGGSRATRLRGRFVRSCPSLGGVGKDPLRRPTRQSSGGSHSAGGLIWGPELSR